MEHMMEFLSWVINGCDYQLDSNVMETVRRWARDESSDSPTSTNP